MYNSVGALYHIMSELAINGNISFVINEVKHEQEHTLSSIHTHILLSFMLNSKPDPVYLYGLDTSISDSCHKFSPILSPPPSLSVSLSLLSL